MGKLIKIIAKEEIQEFDREKTAAEIGSDKLKYIYRNMIRVREFDNAIADLLKMGYDIVQHSTRGQEATQIVATAYLNEEDYVMPYHRGWGWAIGKGMRPDKMMAEVCNKKTGYNNGRAGAQLGNHELKVMGRPGTQAAQIPIGTGLAFSCKLFKNKQMVLCMNGNGASNAGNFYEALNMGGTLKLPIVYIVENNLYEAMEKLEDTTAVEDIALRGLGVGMPSYIVDGNDAIMLCKLISDVYGYVRAENGPVLIEAKTYRHEGHGNSDIWAYGGYRSKEEVDEWIKKDPVPRLRNDLLNLNMITQSEIDEIHNEAIEEMVEAKEFAISGEYPTKEELFLWNYVEQY